jgi:hypothetical protein
MQSNAGTTGVIIGNSFFSGFFVGAFSFSKSGPANDEGIEPLTEPRSGEGSPRDEIKARLGSHRIEKSGEAGK